MCLQHQSRTSADRGRQWRMGSESDWQISVGCCRTEVSGVIPQRSVIPSRNEGSKLLRRSYKNTGGGSLRSQSTFRQLRQFIQSSGVLRNQLPAGKTLTRSSSFTSHRFNQTPVEKWWDVSFTKQHFNYLTAYLSDTSVHWTQNAFLHIHCTAFL